MTLVLNLVTKGYTFHVSDRLVSQRVHAGTGFQYREVDALSNKTIILRARDAVVTVGYCGRAYMDDVPTDTWIAESLLGARLPGPFVVGVLGDTGPPRDIGVHLRRCVTAVSHLPPAPNPAHRLEVSVAGWRYSERRRRLLPLVCDIAQSASQPHVSSSLTRPHWNSGVHPFGYTVTP